jgi:hypothetical protein
VFAIEGWSWSKSAEAVWESIDDWVASAANDEVVSWYLRDRNLVSPCLCFERNFADTYNLQWARQYKCGCGIERSLPECLFVQTIALFYLVKRVLLERGFDVIQDVIHMMFVWPNRGVKSK